MKYEPLKQQLNLLIKQFPSARRLLYFLLDAILLRQWYVKRAIRKCLPGENFRFFDAGCGFGQYSYYVLHKFRRVEVLAVDINDNMLKSFQKYAVKRFGNHIKTETADLQDYRPKNKQNIILSVDILEHIENDSAVLKNFRQCIEDDGFLVISTPYSTEEAAFTEEHFRDGYTAEELEKKLRGTGWRIEDLQYSYGYWGKIAWHLTVRIPLSCFRSLLIVFLPIYYLVTYPFIFSLMLLDFIKNNREGNGMIIIARPETVTQI